MNKTILRRGLEIIHLVGGSREGNAIMASTANLTTDVQFVTNMVMGHIFAEEGLITMNPQGPVDPVGIPMTTEGLKDTTTIGVIRIGKVAMVAAVGIIGNTRIRRRNN